MPAVVSICFDNEALVAAMITLITRPRTSQEHTIKVISLFNSQLGWLHPILQCGRHDHLASCHMMHQSELVRQVSLAPVILPPWGLHRHVGATDSVAATGHRHNPNFLGNPRPAHSTWPNQQGLSLKFVLFAVGLDMNKICIVGPARVLQLVMVTCGSP